jgi:hypothetical protein
VENLEVCEEFAIPKAGKENFDEKKLNHCWKTF